MIKRLQKYIQSKVDLENAHTPEPYHCKSLKNILDLLMYEFNYVKE